jgi:hypothetical protein
MADKQCPNCNKIYITDYPTREECKTAIQREQHQTGLCSDECWDEFLGI